MQNQPTIVDFVDTTFETTAAFIVPRLAGSHVLLAKASVCSLLNAAAQFKKIQTYHKLTTRIKLL